MVQWNFGEQKKNLLTQKTDVTIFLIIKKTCWVRPVSRMLQGTIGWASIWLCEPG
jgi:hypothetical protein